MKVMQLTLFRIMLPNRRGVCLSWWESGVANSRLKHPRQHVFPSPYTPNCMCHWVSLHCFPLWNPQVTSPTYKPLISQFRMSVAFIAGICGALASPAWRRPTRGFYGKHVPIFSSYKIIKVLFRHWCLQCCWGTKYWRTMMQPQGKSKADQISWKKKCLFHLCYSLSLGLMLIFDVQLSLLTKLSRKKYNLSLYSLTAFHWR